MWKRGEIAPKEHYFIIYIYIYIYIPNFRSQMTYSFVKCGCSIYYFTHSLNSYTLYVEVRISQSVSVSSLEFEITRGDYTKKTFHQHMLKDI